MPSYLTHIATAIPEYAITQSDAYIFMEQALQLGKREQRMLRVLYRATQIEQRHSVIPDYVLSNEDRRLLPSSQDLTPFPSTAQRMAIYKEEAPKLALKAIERCLPLAERQSITHLITVSCTGMYAPGLDIDVVHAAGLPLDTHRIAINFMGCYAAFNALKTADAICRAFPEAKVLIVDVELCTLHFQKSLEEDYLLSNALFSDGAAVALVEGKPKAGALALEGFYATLIPQGHNDMAWNIGDFGFEMRLSSYIPKLLSQNLTEILTTALSKYGINLEEVAHWAIHPGGKRILEEIAKKLALPKGALAHSSEVLRQYGNMSSATIFFVLERYMKSLKKPEKLIAMAFGPGLTLETALLGYVPAVL